MLHPRWLVLLVVLSTAVAACDDTDAEPLIGSSIPDPASETTVTQMVTTEVATTTTVRLVPLLDEPPPAEQVTLITEDGVSLSAKYWPGGPVAVLAGHDFHTRTDAANGASPRSSESLVWWTGAVANAGYTVLSPDYRGHGDSPGDPQIQRSPVDLKAAYQFLVDAGYQKIVMAGSVGSGTAGIVLDALDEEVTFDGLVTIWSAPREMGLDAMSVLELIEAPVYVLGWGNPVPEQMANQMAAEVDNLYDLYIFPSSAPGDQFMGVFGEEFIGRLLDFIDYVAVA